MSVLLGQHVREALLGSAAVTAIVGSKIYPVVAMQGVPSMPFVRFATEITGCEYVKGSGGIWHVEDHCTVTVNCVSDDYDEALALQQAVRDALECVGGTYSTYQLDPMEVTHADCIFNDQLPAFDAEVNFSTNTQVIENNG